MLHNGQLGQIEIFIKIETKIHAIIRLMKKDFVTPKTKQRNLKVEKALLNINKFICYCNLTNNFSLIQLTDLKEKVIICETTNFPQALFYVTPFVIAH